MKKTLSKGKEYMGNGYLFALIVCKILRRNLKKLINTVEHGKVKKNNL